MKANEKLFAQAIDQILANSKYSSQSSVLFYVT